ncbi:tripartite tricarboxylate transporter substrate binding protein [Halobacillus salinarum]|uniref:Tripartite tricarboxylate transporter substrate binding protein n=1 Tax=Halobacillus salinarum TaxID=2932257 RepID=A0ABY4EJY8_9BACI|nr:tripartite tricarboxylate transporter substrate binding protein [Halobacillus salinarum]UOQ44285.1 tripartite tricarboxylate transporter substrate binding protein [Halobacillus salinarum]
MKKQLTQGRKIMMKRVLSLMLIVLLFVITGCNASGSASSHNSNKGSISDGQIELIVPYAAGGGTDAVARSIAKIAEKKLNTSIGVVNKPGGGGAVGMSEGANAKPDGHTLTLGTVELTTLPHLGLANFTYKDFTPVAQLNFDPAAITVPADAPYDTIQEFIDYAKENPGEIRVGGSGTGAIWHLAAESFAKANGIDLKFVPFDGAAPSITSLLGGHIEAVSVSPGEVLTQVKAGKLKTLAVMSDERSKALPDVPTLKEEGVKSVNVGAWRGIIAPKDTPDDVVKELETAFLEAAESKEFKKFMDNNGLGIKTRSSEEFKEEMRGSNESFKELIQSLGIAK